MPLCKRKFGNPRRGRLPDAFAELARGARGRWLNRKIDCGNRQRQHALAMESFVTHAFPFSIFTTILGISFADAYYLHLHLNRLSQMILRSSSVATACFTL